MREAEPASEPVGSDSSRAKGAWAAYAAALWALIFAFLHGAWAAGWYVGLPEAEARWAFSRRWFWFYDVIVTAACALAVLVALALVRPEGHRAPRRLVGILAWSGTGLLVLRGGGGILQTVYLVAAGRYVPKPMHLYELWFCLGAILFSMSLWRFRQRTRSLRPCV